MKSFPTTLKVSLAVLTLVLAAPQARLHAKDAPAAAAADTHLAVINDLFTEFDTVFAAADTAKDAATATAAKPKLEASAVNLGKIADRAKALGQPNEAARKTFPANIGEKMMTNMGKIDTTKKRLAEDATLKPAADGFTTVEEAVKKVMAAMH